MIVKDPEVDKEGVVGEGGNHIALRMDFIALDCVAVQ